MLSTRRRKILVFTSGRSDYGILQPLLRELARTEALELELFVTGSHLDDRHGHTVDEIRNDGFAIGHAAPILQAEDDWRATAAATARAIDVSATALVECAPDVALLLGDRFEALGFAIACHLSRVPLVHLHGGEVTVGSADDANRHAITKFASQHLVAAEEFGRRVRQLGEAASTVHVVGAMGLDAILDHRSELEDVEPERQSLLVTYHPPTAGGEDPLTSIDAVLEACQQSGLQRIIVTSPNADHGGQLIRDRIAAFEQRFPQQFEVVDALGAVGFHRAAMHAVAVVGNSSAGLIEVPFLGTPTINVGTRQDGRPRADSVIDVPATSVDISRAIEWAQAKAPMLERFASTIYGDGHAVDRIIPVLTNMTLDGPEPFADLPFVTSQEAQ